ncbi:SGNH/GDSL hydrolase family protein [Priestia flexa]|uniref:SGNH/GDSL hydrolase family protein n=1 Tax=Priestia flexa TaxID=86664 RepID=UPI002492A507|nr:SGNH/GDSL hydrolase family protein [Priestia flexa]
MKVFVNILAIIVLIATIVGGKIYWDSNTSAAPASQEKSTSDSSESKAVSGGSWESYTSNLPDSIVDKLAQASETGEPMNLMIVGSQAMSKDENSWPMLLKAELDKTYGTSLIDVTVYEYEGMNTLEFVRGNTYEDIVKADPDVLLFEPFLLNDNGVVGIKNTLDNLSVIMSHITKEVDGVVTILQPSQPIYNATNYPKEAKELEVFSKENGYEYVDHWGSWPDYTSEEILEYLSEDQRTLTDKGHKAWSEALINYFVAS